MKKILSRHLGPGSFSKLIWACLIATLLIVVCYCESIEYYIETLGLDRYTDEAITPVVNNHIEVVAKVYAYNSEVSKTDSDPFIMASGKIVYNGAIACPSFMDLETKIGIDGKIYTCEDRMAPRYRDNYNFDIWMETTTDAINWGVQEKLIKIYNSK